ncbi:TetR/AcrR family transcriptional regulator [Zavarzinella formosa]|uniref:TetR/AcrR family transcriptional regulator n=1 Tax=Zavarzinella formosa TaxID=360055 RepID=UPI0002D4880A|nr:TetR/AcrR family transcriptional regulator [Zavarzinella formosa]
MNPRPYRLGQRQTAAEQTRARIVAASRELLSSPDGVTAFTVDAVASQAGVARMTVYNQFGSKTGLLEALFDDLAARGLIDRLRAAFGQPEPRDALTELIGAFGNFWETDRLVIRRIRGLSLIDADISQTVRVREEYRREGFRTVVGRITEKHGKPLPEAVGEVVNVLHTLTSFETFDHLAGETRSPLAVVPLVCRLALAALELEYGEFAAEVP